MAEATGRAAAFSGGAGPGASHHRRRARSADREQSRRRLQRARRSGMPRSSNSNRPLPIYRRLGERAEEARILINLGDAFQRLKRFAEARRCFDQALAVARSIKDKETESFALARQAACSVNLKPARQGLGACPGGPAPGDRASRSGSSARSIAGEDSSGDLGDDSRKHGKNSRGLWRSPASKANAHSRPSRSALAKLDQASRAIRPGHRPRPCGGRSRRIDPHPGLRPAAPDLFPGDEAGVLRSLHRYPHDALPAPLRTRPRWPWPSRSASGRAPAACSTSWARAGADIRPAPIRRWSRGSAGCATR